MDESSSQRIDERLYWLGFSSFPGIGPKKFSQLISEFRSAKASWHADEDALEKILGYKLTEKFLSFRLRHELNAYAEMLEKKDVRYLLLSDDDYPSLLKTIANPPFVLYVKGEKEVLALYENQKYIGVVGTRKITQYGREVTEMFTQYLVNVGCVIVSGLAMGVDAVSHMTTVKSNGKTIAVLGSGVDVCYPESNQYIYDVIIESGGAIVSEFPLSMPPSIGSFPSRNRIISGLSHGVLVTEGAADSGALITADEALKYRRSAYAIPGPITSHLSKGPYKLIANGGKLVTTPEEILEDLGIKNYDSRNTNRNVKGETKDEQQIINLLRNEPLHFDEIVRLTGSTSVKIGSLLSIMEMKGMVKAIDGSVFSLV